MPIQVCHGLASYLPGPYPVATIGTFDGVHLGHKVILQRVIDAAAQRGGHSLVVTFHPHPRQVLFPEDTTLRLLHTLEEKIALLNAAGIDKLVLLPFTAELARMPYHEFIQDILVDGLAVKQVVIGYDHRFGAQRGGGLAELQAAGPAMGFEVQEIPAQQVDAANISSTAIRKALVAGDVSYAARLLGYAYSLTGRVVQGRKLGRQLGYPTANLAMQDATKLIPGVGVYAVRVLVPGQVWPGMLSIGYNTTLGQNLPLTIEVNLIGYEGDLYEKELTISLLGRLRKQETYADLEALKAQLALDEAAALSVYGSSLL